MSEPDRFEEKAAEVLKAVMDAERRGDNMDPLVAAALRQAVDDALERAAQLFEEDAKQSEANANSAWHHGESDSVVDHLRREARICRSDAARIRALASPAAAPAAETVRCMCPPGAVAGSCPLRNDVQSICECRCHAAPPSEPAAPKIRTVPMMPVDEAADARMDALRAAQPPEKATGFSDADRPFAKLTEPAPLLPRILAALDGAATLLWQAELRATCIALAAELRAYIAEREKEPELRRLLAQARTIVNAHLLLTDPNEAPANAVIRRLLARIDAAIRRSP